jgi:hypothetical protein
MEKQYQHNGKTYRLKPLSLGMMKTVMPLLVKLRKLQYEYTKDIDMSDLNNLKSHIGELETAKSQFEEQFENDIENGERTDIAGKISVIDDKIFAHRDELNINESFRQKIKLFNECSAMAVYEVVTDEDIIKPVMSAILTCDEGVDKEPPAFFEESGLSWGSMDESFILQVITDFFLLIQKSRMKSS